MSTSEFDQRLALLDQPDNRVLMRSALRGLEREGLRVHDGHIAATPHPFALGSALTHEHITTDYSEALLELITDPHPSIDGMLAQLQSSLTYTARQLNGELLWGSSMPCQLGADEDVPVANYGVSNVGQLKTLYRVGLGKRYGRKMQTIAGIHYNYSLPTSIWALLRRHSGSTLTLQEFKTQGYFGLIRNFRRWFWLLLYLTGASPAMCRSFISDRTPPEFLTPFHGDSHTLHAPYATSLRMGDLGYQSTAQDSLVVCYNQLRGYVEPLRDAILMRHPKYAEINAQRMDDQPVQLNEGLLQIENEFYSTIRPKQTARRGETQLRALWNRGVEYIEVRCIDLNPFEPRGIKRSHLHFVEAFLVACLMAPSPPTNNEEFFAVKENQKRMVNEGRKPGLTLRRDGQEIAMTQWASEIMALVQPVAELLDQANESQSYTAAYEEALAALADPGLTPSARILAELDGSGQTYYQWVKQRSEQMTQALAEGELSEQSVQKFQQEAANSRATQAQIEASDELEFPEYLASYFDQYKTLDLT